MDTPVVTNRRLRLRKWIDTYFPHEPLAGFARAININAGELSGLLRNKPFGEKKARSLEIVCKMPEMWLDLPEGGSLNMYVDSAASDLEYDLLDNFRKITNERKQIEVVGYVAGVASAFTKSQAPAVSKLAHRKQG